MQPRSGVICRVQRCQGIDNDDVIKEKNICTKKIRVYLGVRVYFSCEVIPFFVKKQPLGYQTQQTCNESEKECRHAANTSLGDSSYGKQYKKRAEVIGLRSYKKVGNEGTLLLQCNIMVMRSSSARKPCTFPTGPCPY